jgi:hypothetical protein
MILRIVLEPVCEHFGVCGGYKWHELINLTGLNKIKGKMALVK